MTSRGCCSAPTTHAGGLVMAIAAGVSRTRGGWWTRYRSPRGLPRTASAPTGKRGGPGR